ncbi:MAG: Hsp20/alpha crystallin family protein [Caldibacillus thermoamylovorans]
MWPWGFFGSNKANFDPFQYLSEGEFQQMLDQWMKQAFPDFIQSMMNDGTTFHHKNKDEENENRETSTVKETLFETHDDIFIRIPIQDEKQIDRLKIYYSLNKCVIDGLNEDSSPHTIILPATVKKKGAKAIYRDQILEIRIPKSIEWQMSEIDVDKF